MKKILGVIGSPRKNGNTDILVSKMLAGAKKEGAVIDVLYLNDLKIKECIGCHICWEEKQCPMQDDMCAIYPIIVENDIIIFGTPVYWYGPTALMKMFIDRFVYFNSPSNKTKIKNKSAVIVIPFEEENLETAAPVITFFEKCFQYLQMNLLYKVIVPGVSQKGDVLKKVDVLNEAYEIGRKLNE